MFGLIKTGVVCQHDAQFQKPYEYRNPTIPFGLHEEFYRSQTEEVSLTECWRTKGNIAYFSELCRHPLCLGIQIIVDCKKTEEHFTAQPEETADIP